MESAVGCDGDGKQLICWPHHGEENQQWGWGEFVTIKNLASGMVLDVFTDEASGGGLNTGAWEANGGENQKWKIRPCGGGAFLLLNAEEGSNALDEYQDTEYNGEGKKVGAYERNEGDNQKWMLEPSDTDGQYFLMSVATGQVLDVDMESAVGFEDGGKQVITWPKNGGENQMWTFSLCE